MDILQVDAASPDPEVLNRAGAVLRAGGLIIYPTDTLYAVGGQALDEGVAARVGQAKGRPARKPLPLVAAELRQVEALCAAHPRGLQAIAERFWPGPLTVVLAAGANVPAAVTGGTGTVAVRVPGLELTRRLCALAGPLISTSANTAGAPPPVTCADAVRAVGRVADLALDAGSGRPMPSTIVDLTGQRARLVRAGAVPWEEVRGFLLARADC